MGTPGLISLTINGEARRLRVDPTENLHLRDRRPIMGSASRVSPVSPPPTAAQCVEVSG